MIDFGKKITPAREMRSTNNLHTALESDRGRIINSAAIRRLQQKPKFFHSNVMLQCAQGLPTRLKYNKWAGLLCKPFLINSVMQSKKNMAWQGLSDR